METVDYGRTKQRLLTPRIRRGIVIFLGIIVAMAMRYGAFRSISFCTICGEEQETTELQLPLTNITYWQWSTEHPTPLSTQLRQRGMVPAHQHSYLFASGGGNGIMCAIGSGRHLLQTVNPAVGQFIANVDDLRGREEAASWVPLIFDPDRSSRACGFARMNDDAISTDKEIFNRWWAANADIISELKKP